MINQRRCENRQPAGERGSLTMMGILVLVGLAVLGGAMGWMQLRGTELASTWLNQPTVAYRPMGKLLALGQRLARNQLDELCNLPANPDFTLSIPQWGEVEALFSPRTPDGAQPVILTGRQGNQVEQSHCRIFCPPYCLVGLTTEQCGVRLDGGFNIYMSCP